MNKDVLLVVLIIGILFCFVAGFYAYSELFGKCKPYANCTQTQWVGGLSGLPLYCETTHFNELENEGKP